MDTLLTALKAAGEATRLRIIALLAKGELTVSELTQVLGQSQPRVSRHLKLLAEGGLIDRYQEGTWVFYRVADQGDGARLAENLLELMAENDPEHKRDLGRLQTVRKARAKVAAQYFKSNAKRWNEIRSLYVPEEKVEAHLLQALEGVEISDLLDIGTGTGRMLQVFSGKIERGLGIDLSHDMLAIARATLAEDGIANCQARHGDMYDIPAPDQSHDAIIIHQVLHYADEPERAIEEAARVLRSGGTLLVVDFAPHEEEFLRDDHAHRRLGFHDEEVAEWAASAGLGGRGITHLTGGKLTVTIWRFDKAGRSGSAHQLVRKTIGGGP